MSVLRGIDLVVEQGKWIGIFGPSGSGKSTLLHVAAGLDHPDEGEVRLAGQSLGGLSASQLARLRRKTLGFVFQFHHLMPDLSTRDNVALSLVVQGYPLSKARREAEAILHKLGMGDRLDHLPSQLSGGEQQRVALARAVVHRPLLLLADEPTGNLDETHTKILMDLLVSLRRDFSLTVVMVTHNTALRPYFDQAYFLREGRLERV